jgi:hypothetical protein
LIDALGPPSRPSSSRPTTRSSVWPTKRIGLLSQTFLNDAEGIAQNTSVGDAFQATLHNMARDINLPRTQAQILGAAIGSLVAHKLYASGFISFLALSDGLKNVSLWPGKTPPPRPPPPPNRCAP